MYNFNFYSGESKVEEMALQNKESENKKNEPTILPQIVAKAKGEAIEKKGYRNSLVASYFSTSFDFNENSEYSYVFSETGYRIGYKVPMWGGDFAMTYSLMLSKLAFFSSGTSFGSFPGISLSLSHEGAADFLGFIGLYGAVTLNYSKGSVNVKKIEASSSVSTSIDSVDVDSGSANPTSQPSETVAIAKGSEFVDPDQTSYVETIKEVDMSQLDAMVEFGPKFEVGRLSMIVAATLGKTWATLDGKDAKLDNSGAYIKLGLKF